MSRLASCLVAGSSIAIAACGAGGAGHAKAPHGVSADESIGELAAQQGGIAALGGAGNREGGTAVAMTGPLRIENVSKKNPPKLDGVLGEWHARSPARETISGATKDLGLDVAVQADDETLWIAAEITDARSKRSAKHTRSEDHVTLTLAFPSGRGAYRAYEIGLWPGVAGSAPGAVKWTAGPKAGQPVAGAKLVENDVTGGVTLEASVPWSSFPESHTVRVGLRAALRYHDGDGGGVLATGRGTVNKPSELPPLPTPAEQAVVVGLLDPKGLSGATPDIDVYADVAGDGHKERISVFGRYVTICGPGYRGGEQFYWREVAGDVVMLDARRLTARGKDDLVVRRRTPQGASVHEFLEVWSIPTGAEEPATVFAQQIAIVSRDGQRRVSNMARLSSKEIEVSTEPAVGWDATSFHETLAGDPWAKSNVIEPILLPWGATERATFRLEGGRFVKAREVTRTPARAASKPSAVEPSLPRDVPTPAVRKGSDLGKRVLEAYLKDAGLAPGTKPRVDLEVHVDGDRKPERVALFGRDIVVLGPAFKGGTGYARMSLTQFASDEDVSELTARDLDGDGAAELLVRGARHAKGPAGEDVSIDNLFVYRVSGGSIARVFAIETGRGMGQRRVQGLVQFLPSKQGRGFDIDARPGVARGWTAASYPWAQESPGSGTIEPLLLPWGGVSNVRYSWDGSAFVTAP